MIAFVEFFDGGELIIISPLRRRLYLRRVIFITPAVARLFRFSCARETADFFSEQ